VPTSSRSMRGGIVKSQFDLVSPVGECKASLAPLGPMSLDGLVACPDDGVATNGSGLAIAGCVEHWAVPPDRPGSRHDMTPRGQRQPYGGGGSGAFADPMSAARRSRNSSREMSPRA
jgi:hypothetical protein